MNCQKKTVSKITEKKADYVLALKENQGNMYNDVELYFDDYCKTNKGLETLDKDHGRIEKREYFLENNIDWLEGKGEWSNLKGIGMVKSTIERKGVISSSIRYYISSLIDIDSFAYSVRKHWSIENQLHWCLDVVFREDSGRARKNNSPLNMNVLRKTALFLLKKVNLGKISLRKKMYSAALDFEILDKIVFGEK
jgi:predicted transposase YbfD/YdcC